MKENTDFIREFAPVQHHLHMYIRSLVPNFSDADDLLQEVAATAWKKYESFDSEKSEFKSWLFGIARNKALHSKRRFLRTQNLLNEVQMINAEQFFLREGLTACDERQDAMIKENFYSVVIAIRKRVMNSQIYLNAVPNKSAFSCSVCARF